VTGIGQISRALVRVFGSRKTCSERNRSPEYEWYGATRFWDKNKSIKDIRKRRVLTIFRLPVFQS
jgi:hypothetical protein